MTDRPTSAPNTGAVLRAPVSSAAAPAGEPSVAAPTAPKTAVRPSAPIPASTPAPAPATTRRAGADVLQGRRAGSAANAQSRATADADATSTPIARRRAAARQAALEQERAAAAAKERAAKPIAAPAERKRVIEPPVDIRQRRWGPVHPGQIVAAEAAVLGAAAASRSQVGVLIPVAAASLLVLLACFARIDGRWLYEWLGTGLRYLLRRRESTLGGQEPARELVRSIAHGGDLKRIEVDGAPVAVLTDSTGFTAILEVAPDASASGGSRVLPPLSELLPHNEPGDVPISVQVITHMVPAPSLAAADDAAANSYRELSGGAVPARRRTWVCVQAMHSADVISAKTIEAALINAVRRIERRMRKSGFRPRIRNVRDTAADLLTLIRAEPAQLAEGVRLREAWRTWDAGAVSHVTYRISEWPALAHRGGAAALIKGIDTVPVIALTTSLAGRRVGEYVDVEAVVRFTANGATGVAAVEKYLRELLRGSGADLQRLDGAHRFGVGATLPMGGFAA